MKRHAILRCPIMAQHCYRCFGNHYAKDCLDKPVMLCGVCQSCFLPNRIGDTIFHRCGFMRIASIKKRYSFFALAAIQFDLIPESSKRSIYVTDANGMLNLCGMSLLTFAKAKILFTTTIHPNTLTHLLNLSLFSYPHPFSPLTHLIPSTSHPLSHISCPHPLICHFSHNDFFGNAAVSHHYCLC